MTREQLEHAIRAACEVAEDNELFIIGSQAILGEHPDAPPELRASIEVDVQPANHPERADLIDVMLGELSPFHETHGFYVHGVSVETARLPTGWEARTVLVTDPDRTRGNVGRCLESHDLAASKLFAHREKDRDFVRVLLAEDLIDPGELIRRIEALPAGDQDKATLTRWVEVTARDLER